MTTKSIKQKDIKRAWHQIDAKGEILGRLSTAIAEILIGKNKTYFVSNLDCGDFVVVTNVEKIEVTGRKKTQKMYYSHSNYPGGFKQATFTEMMEKDPRKVIFHAVRGMLPKNKLQSQRLKRLRVFVGSEHPYTERLSK